MNEKMKNNIEKMRINIKIVNALKDLTPEERQTWYNAVMAEYPNMKPALDLFLEKAAT